MTIISTVVGNVGGEVEAQESRNGRRFVRFSLAANRRRGEETSTTWVRVVCFQERLAEVIERNVRKGTQLVCVGEMWLSSFEGRDGTQKQALEMTLDHLRFVGSREEGGDQHRQQRSAPSGRGPAQRGGGKSNSEWSDDLSDDIPFGGVDFEENRHSVAARMGARASVV